MKIEKPEFFSFNNAIYLIIAGQMGYFNNFTIDGKVAYGVFIYAIMTVTWWLRYIAEMIENQKGEAS